MFCFCAKICPTIKRRKPIKNTCSPLHFRYISPFLFSPSLEKRPTVPMFWLRAEDGLSIKPRKNACHLKDCSGTSWVFVLIEPGSISLFFLVWVLEKEEQSLRFAWIAKSVFSSYGENSWISACCSYPPNSSFGFPGAQVIKKAQQSLVFARAKNSPPQHPSTRTGQKKHCSPKTISCTS